MLPLNKLTACSADPAQISIVAMPIEPNPREHLIIPYGIARVTAENLRHVPQVEIDIHARAPLRLGDGPYRRNLVAEEADGAPADNGVSVGAARLDVLRRLHLRDCDVFDKYLRRWIDLYFDYVAAHASEFREELTALGHALDVDFDPLLWGMAAPRPLPRAHIRGVNNDFVAVDVALWDGTKIVALVFAGGDKVQHAQSFAGQAQLLTVDPPTGTTGPDIIAAQLGEVVSGYWRGLAVPPDPFGPAPFRVRPAAVPSF